MSKCREIPLFKICLESWLYPLSSLFTVPQSSLLNFSGRRHNLAYTPSLVSFLFGSYKELQTSHSQTTEYDVCRKQEPDADFLVRWPNSYISVQLLCFCLHLLWRFNHSDSIIMVFTNTMPFFHSSSFLIAIITQT